MFAHIYMIWFCFYVLWKQKSIKKINRLLLWQKSINLYLCLLAFTDTKRPKKQLKSAMICAFLSALYDYDTDWKPIRNIDESVFLALLCKYVQDCSLRNKAKSLFINDWQNRLSKDALERGSGAFRVYCAVINSKWLNKYSPEQLDLFGRSLQQIDDLLDIFCDKKNNQVNCFLTNKKQCYLKEAENFMNSDFFAELVNHAHIYVAIRWYCQHVCKKISNAVPSWIKVVSVFRPITAVYATGVVFAGFKAVTKINFIAINAAIVFFFITGLIMAFNDFVERDHDKKKSKYFASENTWLLFVSIVLCSLVTLVFLVTLLIFSMPVALFSIFVWLAGLFYSHPAIRKWYITQTIIVAFLSACPLLCGSIYSGQTASIIPILFLILFVLILVRELAKDVEDLPFDKGFKETLPVRKGVPTTAFVSLMLVQVVMVLLCLHSNFKFAAYSMAIIQPAVGLMIFNPSYFKWVKRGIDIALCCILISLLVS